VASRLVFDLVDQCVQEGLKIVHIQVIVAIAIILGSIHVGLRPLQPRSGIVGGPRWRMGLVPRTRLGVVGAEAVLMVLFGASVRARRENATVLQLVVQGSDFPLLLPLAPPLAQQAGEEMMDLLVRLLGRSRSRSVGRVSGALASF
jgi:hypothetical protein